MFTHSRILKCIVLLCLIQFDTITGTGRITPLFYKDHHAHPPIYNGSIDVLLAEACVAENLKLTHRYICDSEGKIICIGGWSNPKNLCRDPICRINGRTCVNGECILPNVCACNIGWEGPLCDVCIPMGGCKHGSCKKPMECNCDFGWTGGLCDKAECTGCENGCCHEPHECICDAGWTGHNCTICTTLSNCKHGRCLTHPFQCICEGGWTGLGCSKPICREGCHKKHGSCQRPGECICVNGWTGRNCDVCVPYPGCKGTCIDDVPWTCSDMGDDNMAYPDRWSDWSSWSSCSETCGHGVQLRSRICNDRDGNPGNCMGDISQTRKCLDNYCPIDGHWALWSRWSSCSASCGTGFKTRDRTCTHPAPKFGGKDCLGLGSETTRCFLKPCPINGRWSSWETWGASSTTCGIGIQTRRRMCDAPAPSNGGDDCAGRPVESQSVQLIDCPIDASWNDWLSWSTCSKTCGQGEKSRLRTCSTPTNGGKPCPGGLNEDKEISMCVEIEACVIDGNWSNWNDWTECSVSCGRGVKSRNRVCDNPRPQFGGQFCIGDRVESTICLEGQCPKDGSWSDWNSWSVCSASCGDGNKQRSRTCNQPEAGGKPCSGRNIDTKPCNDKGCPIDGQLLDWTEWSTCSVTCGNGTKTRTRTCVPPQNGGLPCSGSQFESSTCSGAACPIDGNWGSWTIWSTCSASCNGGTRNRQRTCNQPQNGGNPCQGPDNQSDSCNANVPCPIDGTWSIWSQWSTCSSTCAGGVTNRQRTCENRQFGGLPCPGPQFEQQRCNQDVPCPNPNGEWSVWGLWSTCSASCNGGTRDRQRTCNSLLSGRPCVGSSSQQEICNTQSCNGQWGPWDAWNTCSATCNGGTQTRTRSCPTANAGQPCLGSSTDQQACNTQSCPSDGQWGTWSIWSICSRSCNGGTQLRQRPCPTLQIGRPCPGSSQDQQACNTQTCPTNSEWGLWSLWSTCSRTCGGGTRNRQRSCPNNSCIGSPTDQESCNTQPCISNWNSWESWSSCSVTCGQGTNTRMRSCPGIGCPGNNMEQRPCSAGSCPINGGWTEWTAWYDCTAKCLGDRGDQVRRRFCSNPRPQNGGANCVGVDKESKECTGTIPKQGNYPTYECYQSTSYYPIINTNY